MALATTPFPGQSPAQPLLEGGYPYDWSHHHVVYSAATNAAELATVQQQPRYWHEWFRRNAALVRGPLPFPTRPAPSPARLGSRNEGIWGESLAAGGTVGAGNFPAKYSFSTTATPSCSDYVASNTSLPGSGSLAIAFTNSDDATTTHTITITNSSTGRTLTLSPNTTNSNSGAGTGTWINSAATTDYSTNANNFFLALNIAGNGSYVGVYAASVTGMETGATVTVAATQLGPVSISVDNVSVANITTPASGSSDPLSIPANDAGSATATFTATTETGTFEITNPLTGATLTLTAGTSNSGTTWANNSGVAATNAGNFNTILNTAGNGSSVGVYSTVSGAVVTITATQLGSFAISFTKTGVSNLTASAWASGANAARVLAYKDLYATTCSGAPTLSWQYETGGEVGTSVSLSGDGSQLAFVQSYDASSATTAAELVLLKPGTSSTLSIPAIVTAANYRNCIAPCMTSFPLLHDDTNSSPFVDYGNDAIYVGDNGGSLYKFTGVFQGTPAAAAAPFPVTVSANTLTSPVLYSGSTPSVLVADSGGYLYSYTAAGVLNEHSGLLAAAGSLGIVDAPFVDTIAGTVYVWVGEDNTVSTTLYCQNSPYGCDGVFQFTIGAFNTTTGGATCAETAKNGSSWTTGTNCGSESIYGNGSPANVLYDGTFDNSHWSSGGTTGNLWSCSTVGPGGGAGLTHDSLSKIVSSALTTSGFDGGAIIAANAAIYITNAAGACSPTTEIYNGSDYIYVGVTAGGSEATSPICTGGCVYSFILSGTTATVSHGLAASGGSSGLIIDNTGAAAGESQIYFSYLSSATSSLTCPAPSNATTGGCLVQASQAGLQ